ncbi:MAG: hypothetical protein AAF846_16840 [Chloroflexota bacterium]
MIDNTYIAQAYKATPNAEVLGANVSAITGTLRDNNIKSIIKKHNFDDIDTNTWYSQQLFLDLIKEIETALSYEELVAIGMRGAEVVELPPNIEDFEDLPEAIVAAYGLNHRNTPAEEGYTLEKGEDIISIICNIPYPSFILYGYVYGLIKRFAKNSSRTYVVKVDESQTPYRINVEIRLNA